MPSTATVTAGGRRDHERVVARYRQAYPQLHFTIERRSVRVALEAIVTGGTRRVVVHGGFLRHAALGAAALAVALAHEVAHHDPSGPMRADGLCREQWADYWGVRAVLPRVWGAAAPAIAVAGVAQLKRYWRIDTSGPSPPPLTVDYPSPACRVATLEAAIDGRPCPRPY
ncbi:MAG: hypothetical protein AB7U83_14620 [Vicinamibacterales bacterium]